MVGVTTVHRVVLAAGDVLLREGLGWHTRPSGFEVVGAAMRHDGAAWPAVWSTSCGRPPWCVSDRPNRRAVMDVPVQVAGRATQFNAWILVAESALAASGQMRVPATALSKRTLAAMTWKLIAARLKTSGHDARRHPTGACSGSPVTGAEACLPELP